MTKTLFSFLLLLCLGAMMPACAQRSLTLTNDDFSSTNSSTNSSTGIKSSWLSGASGYSSIRSLHEREKAPMIVYFYTDWCGYCKAFNRQLLDKSEVDEFLKSIPRVRINPETGDAEKALAKEFAILGYPSFFVISSQGHIQLIRPFFRRGNTFAAMTSAEFIEAVKAAAN